MKRREAAIISAYTGYLIGDFGDMAKFVEEELGYKGITTIGFAAMADKIKRDAKPYFVELSRQITGDNTPVCSPQGHQKAK